MKLLFSLAFVCSMSLVHGWLAPYHKSTERIDGQYIVKIKEDVSLDGFVSYFESNSENQGRALFKYNSVLHGVAVRLSARLIQWLRGLDSVEYVEEDTVARLDAVSSWGLDRVDQRDLPLDDMYTPTESGSGANVFILDTGIRYTHEDYHDAAGMSRAFPHFDFENGDGSDCNGHGTHCAGIAVGTNYGLAKQAHVHSVRVLSCFGDGSYSNIIAGLNSVAEDRRPNRVASMSLGGSRSTSLNDAVKDAFNAGVVVSVSAGNDNFDACYKSPASAPEALTVGASTSTDFRYVYSNYGPCVDIFAPGYGITSSCYGSDFESCSMSGTSMSCPHVSGAAALLRASNPNDKPWKIVDKMLNDATPNKVTDDWKYPFNTTYPLLYVN